MTASRIIASAWSSVSTRSEAMSRLNSSKSCSPTGSTGWRQLRRTRVRLQGARAAPTRIEPKKSAAAHERPCRRDCLASLSFVLRGRHPGSWVPVNRTEGLPKVYTRPSAHKPWLIVPGNLKGFELFADAIAWVYARLALIGCFAKPALTVCGVS